MRVLFDVSHPAHVHLFKNTIKHLETAGHVTKVTSREKDLTTDLLDAYEIDHTPISAKGDSKPRLITEWIGREARMLDSAFSFDPDVIVSRLNPPASHAASVVGCPSIVFDDSEKAIFPARITHPFADVICTPDNFSRDLGSKQLRYPGFHEFAYLHPNRFDPQPDLLRDEGIDPNNDYAVVRFVSWGAHHDVNQDGLSPSAKEQLIEDLSEHGDVYITSEGELPDKFEEYRLPVPPELAHQLLYHANIYVGDSQTMATEAAVLGTPAVRCNTFAGDEDMSNFTRLEDEYDLLRSTTDESEALEIVRDLLEKTDLQTEWDEKRDQLASDMVDVTDFMLHVIEEVGNR